MLSYGILYDLERLYSTRLYKNCWIGYGLAGDCVQVVYKNVKYR